MGVLRFVMLCCAVPWRAVSGGHILFEALQGLGAPCRAPQGGLFLSVLHFALVHSGMPCFVATPIGYEVCHAVPCRNVVWYGVLVFCDVLQCAVVHWSAVECCAVVCCSAAGCCPVWCAVVHCDFLNFAQTDNVDHLSLSMLEDSYAMNYSMLHNAVGCSKPLDPLWPSTSEEDGDHYFDHYFDVCCPKVKSKCCSLAI